MFQTAIGLAEGGWNALDNVLNTIGKGASILSDFFPARQRDKVISETLEAAGGTGWTFRPTAPEAQSMIETSKWAQSGFIGSPYESQFSVPAKIAESQKSAQTIGTKADPIREGLDWALDVSKKVVTLYDIITDIGTPKREIVEEKPRAGYPEGQDVQHLNEAVQRAAKTIHQTATEAAGRIYDQVKGLFSLGFPQTQPQPTAGVTTAAGVAGLSLPMIAVLALLLYLGTRK